MTKLYTELVEWLTENFEEEDILLPIRKMTFQNQQGKGHFNANGEEDISISTSKRTFQYQQGRGHFNTNKINLVDSFSTTSVVTDYRSMLFVKY